MLKKTAEKLFQNSFLCSAAPSGFVRTSRGWWSFCLSKKLVVVSRAFHLGHRPNVVTDEADGEKKKCSSEIIEIFLECSVNEALEKESNYSISERLPYKPDQYDFLDSFPTVEKL